jgi:hypothetical protein
VVGDDCIALSLSRLSDVGPREAACAEALWPADDDDDEYQHDNEPLPLGIEKRSRTLSVW